MAERLAFYCMSSDEYFPGAVALINSLRLQGHRDPVYVLDCGLSDPHREALSTQATIVEGPSGLPPYLLKTFAPSRHPAETMVLIDVDMVVTRPLGSMLAQSPAGGLLAFKDNIDRFVTEWAELLGRDDARETPYVSSGLVVLAGEKGREVLELWNEHIAAPEYERSWFGRRETDYPWLFLDQDVLNAVISTTLGDDELAVLDKRLAPHQPYRGLRLRDARRLRCAYRDGTEPYVLHQYLDKPWLEPMYHGIYSKLLSRLWLGDDVALRLPRDEIPLRMRDGIGPLLVRKQADFRDLVRWYARDVIPEWIAARRGAR
jgi:hypothetical protein